MNAASAHQVTKIVETKPIVVESRFFWELKTFPDIKETQLESAKIEIPDVDAEYWIVVLPKVIDPNDSNNTRTVFNFTLKMLSEAWKTSKYDYEMNCMTPDKNFPNNFSSRRKVFGVNQTPIDKKIMTASDYLRTNAVLANCLKMNSYIMEFKVTIRYLGSTVVRSKIYDPYESNNEILANVRGLYRNQKFTDFVFIVRGKEFKVHKNILAGASPVFMKLFTSDMEESRTNQCKLDQFEPEIFERFLEYVYTGKAPESFGDHAKEIYTIADYYQLERLKLICQSEVYERLCVANAFETYKWAFQYNLQDVKTDSWEIVKR